jgi:hypothetical protein
VFGVAVNVICALPFWMVALVSGNTQGLENSTFLCPTWFESGAS